MTSIVLALLSLQAFGALFGAVSAVWGEIAYIRAHQDGLIDQAERAHLERIALGLRFGMLTLLLSSFGLIVVSYMLGVTTPPGLSVGYWLLVCLALLTVWASWALSRKRISFDIGSAVVFSAWWTLFYLSSGLLPPLSLGAAVAVCVVVTVLFYLLLRMMRAIMIRPSKRQV